RARRARAGSPRGGRQPVLPIGAGMGALSHDRAGDGGDRDREPGGDHGRVLTDESGGATRPSTALADPQDVGDTSGANLYPPRPRAAPGRRAVSGADVPVFG